MAKNQLVAYALATHGVRRVTKSHPAVRQQLANVEAWMSDRDEEFGIVAVHDYARAVHGLQDLPKLTGLLKANTGVILDDLGRLFRPCPNREVALELMRELEPYGDLLVGLRQAKSLSKLPAAQKALIVSGEQKARFVYDRSRGRSLSAGMTKRSTSQATAASSLARREAADDKAQKLAKIRDRLRQEGEQASVRQIADAANSEGLRTTRGNAWRADTVFRALKRLDQEAG